MKIRSTIVILLLKAWNKFKILYVCVRVRAYTRMK